MIKFFDTCSLLIAGEKLFETGEVFAISSVSLHELEEIKTSANKDAEIKFQSRRLLRLLDQNPDKFQVIIYNTDFEEILKNNGFEFTNDNKIAATAYAIYGSEGCEFVTNDLALKQIAKTLFKEVSSVAETNNEDDYSGYKEVLLTNEEMAELYTNLNKNIYQLNTNEYLLVYNEDKELVDELCWTGTTHRKLSYKNFNSRNFGKVRPKVGDVYQRLAADSLANNQITMLKGPAGSGKTLLSLGYLMNQLDDGYIDKIIIFCNTVATKDSAKLGLI